MAEREDAAAAVEDLIPSVFLSYSSRDFQAVKPVIGALERHGLHVLAPFKDPTLNWGASIRQTIEDTISTRAHAVMVFLSRHFIQSQWCKLELDFLSKEAAGRETTPIILPIRLDDCEPPSFLKQLVYLDLESLGPEKIARAAKERIGSLPMSGSLLRMLPDESLVRRFAEGRDEDALQILYERVYPQIFRWCRANNLHVDAGDVAEEVFRRLRRSAGAFDPEKGSFSAWIAIITRNAAVDYWRKERRSASLRQDLTPEAGDEGEAKVTEASQAEDSRKLVDPSKSPSEAAEVADQAALIRQAISKLPESQRLILELMAEGLTSSEIAERLSLSQSTVRGLWHRAVHTLRDAVVKVMQNG
jgi:RNA polymerase sigma-70 factor, ECF subfamily